MEGEGQGDREGCARKGKARGIEGGRGRGKLLPRRGWGELRFHNGKARRNVTKMGKGEGRFTKGLCC